MRKHALAASALALGLLVGGNVAAEEMKSIAITSIVEVPQLVDVKNGVIEGLKRAGYVEGKNLKIDYQNAQGNMGTAVQIARKFVGDAPDVIVPITTPSAQTVVSATKTIPIVFSTVTDPLGAKIVPSLKHPGGNVTGVSDLAPLEEHIKLIKEIMPNAKRLGLVFNPGLDNSRYYVAQIKELAPKVGMTVTESPAPTSNDVIAAMRALVGKVDAVYMPNDTTVYAALEAAVKVAEEAKLPLFTGETRSVQRGGIASISFDYFDVGLETAALVKKVLDGTKPGDIDVIVLKDTYKNFQLHINAKSAKAMGVTIPEAVLKRAKKIYD
jgi:putative tryptophan/tyrosine transport system substrate-binding protein